MNQRDLLSLHSRRVATAGHGALDDRQLSGLVSPSGVTGGDVLSVMMDDRSDEAVYATHSSELVRFAAGLVGPDDAPDVVVEAFLRVTRSAVWDRARDKRALWYRAVVFEARSLTRSTARRQVRERRVAATAPTTMVEASRDQRVAEALAVLSSQQRAVVMLTYWADLDPAGVGRLLGISDGSVKKQLARARRKLKGELGHG